MGVQAARFEERTRDATGLSLVVCVARALARASAVGADVHHLVRRLVDGEGRGRGVAAAVVDTILEADSRVDLPPWLVQLITSDTAHDPAAAVRALVARGRVDVAAKVVTAAMDASVRGEAPRWVSCGLIDQIAGEGHLDERLVANYLGL